MIGQDPADDVLIDLNPEGESDLLGDARTSPGWIPPFHFQDSIDELLGRTFGSRTLPALRREQQPIFASL
jgi:hypothetical protein